MTKAMKAAPRRRNAVPDAPAAERNWVRFAMTAPTNAPNGISIDPNPNATAQARARLLGKGCGPLRAGMKAVR